ncbi:MAG: putative transcriptional regulator [Promethearchaeota archaeon CR_4]|nr:MAG: putative transcriptional regulator [Candidatus Lokiarchaeota archaeon CR_4]
MTAGDLAKRSKIPKSRIYDVLTHLIDLGLIELQEGRPKRYRAVSPATAFQALLARKEEDHKGEIQHLYHQVNDLLTTPNLLPHPTPDDKTFWSAASDFRPMVQLYQTHMRELSQELLITGIINEYTEQVLPFTRQLYGGLIEFLARHGRVRYLWSFNFDERNLTDAQKIGNDRAFRRICQLIQEWLPSSSSAVEIKYVHVRFFTYFDLFDRNRAFLKIQHPLKTSAFFSCIMVNDPEFVRKLGEYFDDLWFSHAIA